MGYQRRVHGEHCSVLFLKDNLSSNLLNMKSMLLVALFVAVAAAQDLKVEYKDPIPILRSAQLSDETGKYSYSYETGNGIVLKEEGEQKLIGDKPEEVGSVSRGSYSYDLEGVTYTVIWDADENGFQPTGAHLPVAPAMPEHVVKLLADLKAAGQL